MLQTPVITVGRIQPSLIAEILLKESAVGLIGLARAIQIADIPVIQIQNSYCRLIDWF